MMVAANRALSRFSRVFPGSLPKIIGMIHVQPLPGIMKLFIAVFPETNLSFYFPGGIYLWIYTCRIRLG